MVRLTDRPDMTLIGYRRRKTTTQKTDLDFQDYFGRGKPHFILEFYKTELDIWGHSGEVKTLNM